MKKTLLFLLILSSVAFYIISATPAKAQVIPQYYTVSIPFIPAPATTPDTPENEKFPPASTNYEPKGRLYFY